MRDDFGVGLGLELVALRDQALFEGEVVLDDTVVDDDDVALAVAVRVGVFLGGAAVGGPTGMADPIFAVDRVELNGLFEVAELALGAPDGELVVVAIDRQARGIISAIFEPFETFQNDRNGALCSDVPHDSAHTIIIGCGVRTAPRPRTATYR